MKYLKSAMILSLATILVLSFVPTPAYADPPPPGYPTDQIFMTVRNLNLPAEDQEIPIRRGFWDSDVPNQGFGFDKAYHKHNIRRLDAMAYVLGSDEYTEEGPQYSFLTYAYKFTCSPVCVPLTVPVRGVSDTRVWINYYGWPVRGRLGQLTIYCVNGDTVCPDWVDDALAGPHPAKSVDSSDPTVRPTPNEILQTQEVPESHCVLYLRSYQPLDRLEFPTGCDDA